MARDLEHAEVDGAEGVRADGVVVDGRRLEVDVVERRAGVVDGAIDAGPAPGGRAGLRGAARGCAGRGRRWPCVP